jgi:glycosyltransferase involved in cell wall biosynthesis
MNALFIGPYRQADGWGAASRDYINAIATQITNITTRPLYYTKNTIDKIDSSIESYEKNLYDHYDIVFQKSLPHNFTLNKTVKKNVGLTVFETNNISSSQSIANINFLDEVCVPSSTEAKSLRESGVTIKIKVVSQPIDIEKYRIKTDSVIQFESQTKKTFYFYTIGEYIERKNLKDLIIAFNLAFDNIDDVGLVIKTSVNGMNAVQAKNKIQSDISEIKKTLRIRKQYKKETIITDRLTDTDMISLHNACHCFVIPSFGEAFCRPAAEALILGNTPIVTDKTGCSDFINNNNGYLINSRKHPVILNQPNLSADYDIYNASEYWYQPSVTHLIECMQKAYKMYRSNRPEYEKKKQIGIDSIEQFSYTTIGKKICD